MSDGWLRLRPHSAECFALDNVDTGTWRNAWGLADLGSPGYDLLGRRNVRSMRAFLVFHCNDPRCQGAVAIDVTTAERRLRIPTR